MLLSALCEELGISRRVVQGMEAANLVKPTSKNKYGYLEYDDEAVERIKLIRTYQRMGFRLSEIKEIFDSEPEVEVAHRIRKKIYELEMQKCELDYIIATAKNMLENIEKQNIDKN